jgi:hypothetical protein
MFIAMGYDQDHINMMREFNEVSIVRSGERWEAERQRRQTALEREVNRPMEAIFNAAADVRNRTVAAGKEYGTIVYAVNRDGHTIYGHTALVTDDLANKVDTDSAEQFLPDGATPIALVHGHPDANFEQGGQTWHTKPEEWSPGDEVALAQRQARYGDLPRETGRPASMLSAIVVTAGGDVKWFRDKETGHHTIGRAR